MSRLMFVYLSGTEKGKTRIFKQEQVTIGTDDSFDLTVVPEDGGHLPQGLLAEVYEDVSGELFLVPRYKDDFFGISINGEKPDLTAQGYELQDGDTIHFGHGLSSASILFQVMPENFSTASLIRQSHKTLEPQPTAQPVHPLTATLFVKELSASLWAEVPRKAKAIGLALVGFFLLAASVIIFMNFLILHRNTSRIEALNKKAEDESARRSQDQEIIKKQ